MRHIIILSLLIISNQAFSGTADGFVKEFDKIIKTCKSTGFYKCQEKYFQGETRGLFHLPIETQKLRITENEYKDFIRKHTKDGITFSLLKNIVNIDFNLEDQFDVTRFSPDNIIDPVQPLNPENTLLKFNFKNSPPIVLVIINNEYKLGILPEQESEYRKTGDFKKSYIFRLKNNILKYHMKEAEMLNYDMPTLQRNVSEAQAPIMFMLEKGIVPDFVKDYMSKKTMKDIQRFYIQLDTEDKIIKKIKQVHNL